MKLKNIIWIIVISLACNPLFARRIYVDAAFGNDENNGLFETFARKSIQSAAALTQPGDTVFIKNGTYASSNGSVLTLNPEHSGNAVAPVVYMAFPGHKPKIKVTGNVWNAIIINASYVVIEGLELEGNNAALKLADATAAYQDKLAGGTNWSHYAQFNTNGITLGGNNESKFPHHIIIRNCRVHDFPGGGIVSAKMDYITIENNVVYNNAWFTMYAPSGISLFHSWNSDSETKVKNFIRNNICYNNKTQVPWISIKKMSDGNGIIIDDNRNTQDTTAGPAYKGRTLVENNICFNNGGSGIHAYSCQHVDIVNNTAYGNGTVVGYADIFAGDSKDVKILNNIMYARDGGKCTSNNNNTNVVYDYNLYYNGSYAVLGPNDKVSDPMFASLSSDPTMANFYLRNGSPAIDKGTNTIYSARDIQGTARPHGVAVDIGAYEYDPALKTSSESLSLKSNPFIIYPNPVTYSFTVECETENQVLQILNLKGQLIRSVPLDNKIIQVSAEDLKAGYYIIKLENNQSKYYSKLMIKK